MTQGSLYGWLKEKERAARGSFGQDLSTPAGRRGVWLHFNLFDHAFLRTVWTNFDEVADGVYRSNHPGPRRLEAYKRRGIRSVLNLRGVDGQSPWLLEKEACDRLGLRLDVAKIYARRTASSGELLALIKAMRELPKPMVMHCKSGADRAGLASALYILAVAGGSLEEARSHLALRYIHLKSTMTGAVDHIIDLYAERLAKGQIDVETWLATEYDAEEAQRSFEERRAQRRWF